VPKKQGLHKVSIDFVSLLYHLYKSIIPAAIVPDKVWETGLRPYFVIVERIRWKPCGSIRKYTSRRGGFFRVPVKIGILRAVPFRTR